MPTTAQNYRVWDQDHSWRLDDDEWHDQADFCGQPGPCMETVPVRRVHGSVHYEHVAHIEREEFKRYLAEFARYFKIGGVAVIHHPNAPHSSRFFTKFFLVNMMGLRRFKIADYLFGRSGNMGRSSISGRMVRSMAENSGLQPVIQTATWGPNHKYNCLKFNDQISVLKKA